MHYEISDEAEQDLLHIEDYLLKFWNLDILIKFQDKLSYIIEILLDGKVIFQRYENTELHKILITKHSTMIYNIENDILYIHRIIQNFQDPEENFKSIIK